MIGCIQILKITLEILYLFVEVEETFGAVYIVKWREGLNCAVYCHGVQTQGPTRGHQHPVRRRSADEHLTNRCTITATFLPNQLHCQVIAKEIPLNIQRCPESI